MMTENIGSTLTQAQEDQLKRNLEAVLKRFEAALQRAGRKPESAHLVAVSKWHPLGAILAVARHWRELGGRPVFGENYLQEAQGKQLGALEAGERGLVWHFTGHLQSRKGKQAAGCFELIHSLDSLSLAQNLQKSLAKPIEAAKDASQGAFVQPQTCAQPVLIQVNIGQEDSKSGLAAEKVEEFIQSLQGFDKIDVQGLMILPPFSENPEDTRPYFSRLRQMRDSLEKNMGIKLPHLSMGMSHDFEVALEEGATLARVGTDIFGQREY